MRARPSTAIPFRPAAVAHHRNSHRDDEEAVHAVAATPRLGLAILALSVAAVIAVAAVPLHLRVGGHVARVQSSVLEVAFDHPLATSLILADARLRGSRGEVPVAVGGASGPVADHVQLTASSAGAFAAGDRVTLTFETSFLRLLMAHGVVRS